MGGMEYECPYCGDTFAHRQSRQNHIRKGRCSELSSTDDLPDESLLDEEPPFDEGYGRDPELARAVRRAYPFSK